MKLPGMKYMDGIGKSKQIKFGGMDHNHSAKDGALWDMKNLTSSCYPLLATRAQRALYRTLEKPGGIYSWKGLCWVDGTGFYFDGKKKGDVAEGQKVFASMGPYIVIFPDKLYYNTSTGEFGALESKWQGEKLEFIGHISYGDTAKANAIRCEGVDWNEWFRSGDGVFISGCTKHTENNKSAIIRAIDGDTLQFDENAFTLDGDEGITDYTEEGQLRIERRVPDLAWVFENENRMWGCTDRGIYSSKQSDLFNWNDAGDLLAGSSWSLTPESAGDFTGGIVYKGYCTFFKEEQISKIYGSMPSNYQLMGSATLGLAEGSGRSLAIAGETLFYLGRNGIMAYTGGVPQCIGQPLGHSRFKNAVAGSDGLKYFVSMEDEQGAWGLYVYDTQRGVWHKEDDLHATHFARHDGNLYCLTAAGEIWVVGDAAEAPEGAEPEEKVEWMAEFADFTEDDPNKKGVSKLQIRLELEEGATVTVWMQFDSDGMWRQVRTVLGEGMKRSYYLPISPRRADHYRLKLTGTGQCRIYSLVRESYSGSEY